MINHKKEPSDRVSLWLKFRKLIPQVLIFARIVLDVMKLLIEK